MMIMDTVLNEDSINAFIVTILAGLSTGIGGLLVIFYGKPSPQKLGHFMSFSAGVMIYISFVDLLPEATENIGFIKSNISLFLGILFFAIISKLVPDFEAHDHGKDSSKNKDKKEFKSLHSKKQLLRVGMVTALGISLHNFPEGIAVYLSSLRGLEIGFPIAVAIAAHNIPEGMAVAGPIYHSTKSKWQALKYSFLSGICEPIAALLFGLFFFPYINETMIHLLLAAVAGIMILVSLKELIPTSLKYITPDSLVISLTLGMIFISTTIYYLHASNDHVHNHNNGHHHH